MEKEELQELFCIKIGLEKERFKRRMLKQEPEEIFAGAYQIDTMISIYELLLEMSHEIGEDTLKKLIVFPNLMAFLFRRWRSGSRLADLYAPFGRRGKRAQAPGPCRERAE